MDTRTDAPGTDGLSIRTVTAYGNSVSVSPARGGIVTSLILGGRDILFLNQETFRDQTTNVRGGIPILFPNAGVAPGGSFPRLAQHGFARNSDRWQYEETGAGFVEILRSDETTMRDFPFPFTLKVEGELRSDGSFSLLQTVRNTGMRPLPIAMGLHPYFQVPSGLREELEFRFEGGEVVEQEKEMWMREGTYTTRIDNPGNLTISLPGEGSLQLTFSSSYRRVWFWALPGQDFICVEPALRDPGGLTTDPHLVPPGEECSGRMDVSFLTGK